MANGVTQIRRSVLTLALPVTVSSLLQRTEGIVAVFLVGGLGAIPIAAVGLGQLLAFIATTLVSGLSVGTNVIVAQLWGARRHHEAGQAARRQRGPGAGDQRGRADLPAAADPLVLHLREACRQLVSPVTDRQRSMSVSLCQPEAMIWQCACATPPGSMGLTMSGEPQLLSPQTSCL